MPESIETMRNAIVGIDLSPRNKQDQEDYDSKNN